MKALKIKAEGLQEFLRRLMAKHEIYIPKGLGFERSTNPAEFELPQRNTQRTIKELFFPPYEPLLRYRLGRSVEIEEPLQGDKIPTRIIFGTRPCDALGVELIGRVFLEEPVDEFFKERLEKTHIVSFVCAKPDKACFCTSLHEGPIETRGSDFLFIPYDEGFLVEVVTERGAELLEDFPFDEASDEELRGIRESYKAKVNKALADVSSLPKQLQFDNPRWRDAAPGCIDCGICTFLCPTCHCFDIQDEGRRTLGERVRIWDSCMFYDFTKMAVGQPRPEHYRRYRQRLMHKFKYFPEAFGELLCTGCGRCIRHCPVGINLIEVLDYLRGGTDG
jgi:ferredoxin